MGKVIITVRIYPTDIDIDLNKIFNESKKVIEEIGGKVESYFEVPIAFGLKALEIKFFYPDKEFNEEEFIEKLKKIEGVENAEIISASLAPF